MNLLTKAAGVAPASSTSPGEPGFSLAGLASGVVDGLRSLGIIVAYLAGSYGDDRAAAGSGD